MKNIFEDIFKRPSFQKVVEQELAEARLALLKAEEAFEYAQALVIFNKSKIARLSKKVLRDHV